MVLNAPNHRKREREKEKEKEKEMGLCKNLFIFSIILNKYNII